jgi:hypothetical protein
MVVVACWAQHTHTITTNFPFCNWYDFHWYKLFLNHLFRVAFRYLYLVMQWYITVLVPGYDNVLVR